MFAWRKPQKKISWICKRIENATKLFEVDRSTIDESWTKILIIDDVLGSWATVNTLARKVKNVLPNCSISWFAMLWSYRKGFDVVTWI
jgi:predicted amidophosphoribosyltransferase